jgi:hypothetical protein
MNRIEYFLAALRAEAWRYRSWLLCAFTEVDFSKIDPNKELYPYRLHAFEGVYHYYDAEASKWVGLEEGVLKGSGLYPIHETFVIKPGDLANVVEEQTTTFANAFFNATALCFPFGNTIPYYNKEASPEAIEGLFIDLIVDTPADGEPVPPGKVTVTQVYQHQDVMFNIIGNMSSIAVASSTRRMLVPSKAILALRDRLLEEHKHELDNLTVVAGIIKQLVDALKEDFKNDPGASFMIKNKQFDTILLRNQVIFGVEMSFHDDGTFALITKSLAEGWDFNRFSEMNNSARLGSFNRGANTALGGEGVKLFYRRYQNTRLIVGDCKTTVYIPRRITKQTVKRFYNNFAMIDGALVKIMPENAKDLIDKTVLMRDPATCKIGNGDICSTCFGESFINTPNAIANVAAEAPSQFMYIFMKKMHGTALKITKLNLATCIS